MIKIHTKDADYDSLDNEQQGWVYNALDCCLTHEIWEVLQEKDLDYCKSSYDFVRAMQAPAMAMGLQGMLIDMNLRGEMIRRLQQREAKLEERLDRMTFACWGEGLNPRSPKKIIEFLYDHMNLKTRYKWDSKTKKQVPSSDITALEDIIDNDKYYARPICKHIIAARKVRKLIGVLETGIDADGYMRTSYNVTGTETGRWSSNANCFGTGTNLQNITNEIREMFIAEEGWKFAYLDLEQAESRAVAYLSGDEEYINACESGDLHVYTAKLIWPDLPWTGDPVEDLKIAGEKFYEEMSYRDLAKRGGHGTNYLGSAYQMAKHLHVSKGLIEKFQSDYFRAFPGIPRGHQHTATMLQTTGKLSTPMGRTRYFLARLTSDDTLKEAIAFVPQSTVGEILNLGMYYLWRDMVLTGEIRLMAQIHDAVLIQYRDNGDHDYQRDVLARAVEKLTLTIPVEDIDGKVRDMTIPAAIEGVGWNWKKFDKKINNIDSLMSVEQDEETNRTRSRSTNEATSFLARRIF